MAAYNDGFRNCSRRLALSSLIIVILSMPYISGQGSGLLAGIIITIIYLSLYFIMRLLDIFKNSKIADNGIKKSRHQARLSAEFSKELTKEIDEKVKTNNADCWN